MKEIVKVKEKYSVILENYRRNNSVLNYSYRPLIKFCLLCGGSILTEQINEHMNSHNIEPDPTLIYRLAEPFRKINTKIKNGATFIKLIVINKKTGFGDYYPANALNLKNFSKVTDANDCTVRYSAKQRKFIKSLW